MLPLTGTITTLAQIFTGNIVALEPMETLSAMIVLFQASGLSPGRLP
ncbi:MAG: hypothetical protein R1F54_08990 [Candidatus Zeuxoniibacter abyssi]|nr:MAG: hypothetical protein R1F54_08990 [Candidatus Persebacteraceae bacterium AB1(2)]